MTLRTLGPRRLEHVPLAELAEALRVAAGLTGWTSTHRLFDATVRMIGGTALTPKGEAALTDVLAWARDREAA